MIEDSSMNSTVAGVVVRLQLIFYRRNPDDIYIVSIVEIMAHLPPGVDVGSTLRPVSEVVGMLPHIQCNDRCQSALEAKRCGHERVVLIGCR